MNIWKLKLYVDRTVGLSAELESYSLQRTKTEWEENLKPENTEEGKKERWAGRVPHQGVPMSQVDVLVQGLGTGFRMKVKGGLYHLVTV